MIVLPEAEKASVLLAFPYLGERAVKGLAEAEGMMRLLVDSGAFTAWKLGKTIALDDYCRFIETLRPAPWRYFTLDVVGDPGATERNYHIMRSRGFNPVPIFTRGEDASVLDSYFKTSDVVGIGGLVGTKSNKEFVNGIMHHVGTRRVHWLGFARFDYLKHYRPYMCDSTSWEAGARFGSFPLYMGNGQFIRISKKNFEKRPSEEILNRIASLGFDPYILRKEDAWRGTTMTVPRMLGAACALDMSLDIQRHIGTYFFNAMNYLGVNLFTIALKRRMSMSRPVSTTSAPLGCSVP